MHQKPSIDLAHGESVLGDRQSALNLLHLFLEKLPGYMNDIQLSVTNQQWEKLADHAHALKGATCYTSTPQLHSLASELNEICKHHTVKINHQQATTLVTKLIKEYEKLIALVQDHPDFKPNTG